MTEPTLHLHSIPAMPKQESRASVSEGMKRDPLDSGPSRRRLEDPIEVRVVETSADLRSEDKVFVSSTRLIPKLVQRER
jgi:hypothetical protein